MVEFVVKGDTQVSWQQSHLPTLHDVPVTQRMKDALCQETPESAFPSTRRVSTFHLDAFVDASKVRGVRHPLVSRHISTMARKSV